jgi:hypothetical protein
VPSAATYRAMASAAPLRIARPPTSTPLIRVWAVNGTNTASAGARTARAPSRAWPSVTMLLPSGVSSAHDASTAASASASGATPRAAKNSVAWRLPWVIVPVLSRNSTSMSPAASTARPEVAITLAWIIRSMPAMPIADNRPPIVVGIRHTSSATRIAIDTGAPPPALVTA